MLKKSFLILTLILLGYGFYKSEDFNEITAGVVIFLFGMIAMKNGFEAFSGGALEKILKASTSNILKSISFGFVTTTLMQSSALVSVLAISFLGAGMIELIQGIGIIYGANIGTTTGAWLMAGVGLKIKISTYAMPMIVFGAIFMFQQNKSIKSLGYILVGVGFLFLGIHYMMEGFKSLKDSIDLSSFAVPGFKGVLIFVGVGFLATIAMQSSHATIMLVIAALAVGQITYQNAIAIVIGANIGTTVTAIIGSLTSNIAGKRLAGAHFIFNAITALIAIIFISPIINLSDSFSSFLGIDEENFTLKLAVFDTLFKTGGVILFLPFTSKLVIFLEKYIKTPKNKKTKQGTDIDTVRYINDTSLQLSNVAFVSILKESKHLYDNTFNVIASGLNVKKENIISTKDIDEVLKDKVSDNLVDIDELYKIKVKNIYSQILEFIIKSETDSMPSGYAKIMSKIRLANHNMVEVIKDIKHLQRNLNKYLSSHNEFIKSKYYLMQKNIVELLRNLNTMALTEKEDILILMSSDIKKTYQTNYEVINHDIDSLIRDNKITASMATSFINDSIYTNRIISNLINMADILFVQNNKNIIGLSEDFFEDQKEENDINS